MIYLDHAATTPVRAEVREAMGPFLEGEYGNPSSIHALGRQARAVLDDAHDQLAAALHCDYAEVTFTSGGTEADNLALVGVMLAAPPERRRLVVSMVEHHAVLHTAQFLGALGFEVATVPPDADGRILPERLAEHVDETTALVSIMHANNEIGTVNDIARLSRVAHEKGALFHTDAVQSFGALPVVVSGLGCDLASVSAHKIYGPKGVGALYVRRGVRVAPLLHGGAQERERRAGTENVPGIVGFGVAAQLAAAERDTEAPRLTALRDRLVEKLLCLGPSVRLNGPRAGRLPNNVNISIAGVDGAAVLMNLDRLGVAASSGSACSSGSIEPSHVLKAIGLPDDLAASGVRFTLGHSTTEEQVDQAAEALGQVLVTMRCASRWGARGIGLEPKG